MRMSLIGLLILAVGCVRVEVVSEIQPGAEFERYATYAQSPPPDAPLVADSIRSEIDRMMQEKGYETTEIDEADLIVTFSTQRESRQRRQVSSDPDANYFRVANVIEGKLVIELFDPEVQTIVWRGVGTVDAERDSEGPRVATAATRKVLAELPPRTGPS